VEDEGPGIDPSFLPHLFEPFFTGLDVSRHCSGHFELGRKGIGLGLSIVRSFAEMHGGRAEYLQRPGNGSTFVVTLPAISR
jgi:signal transduction histidine kinase